MGEARPYRITTSSPPRTPLPTRPREYDHGEVSRPGFEFCDHRQHDHPGPYGGRRPAEAEPTDLYQTVWFDNWSYVEVPGSRRPSCADRT